MLPESLFCVQKELQPYLRCDRDDIAGRSDSDAFWKSQSRAISDIFTAVLSRLTRDLEVAAASNTHVVDEGAGPESRDGDEGDVRHHVRQLPLYPPPALRPEQRPVHRHHETLGVYQRHLALCNDNELRKLRRESPKTRNLSSSRRRSGRNRKCTPTFGCRVTPHDFLIETRLRVILHSFDLTPERAVFCLGTRVSDLAACASAGD